MKLQLKVFSGSWWATENGKQTQKRRGQPEGFVPSYNNNKSAVIDSSTCYRVWKDEGSVEKLIFYWYYMPCGPHSSGPIYICRQGFTYITPEEQSFCLNDAVRIFFLILLLCNNKIFGIQGCMCGGANVLFKQKGFGTDVNTKDWRISQSSRMNEQRAVFFCLIKLSLPHPPFSHYDILLPLQSQGSCGFWGKLKMIFTSGMKCTILF